MSSLTPAARFADPLMLWADLAVKTQEMLVSSGSVIRMRTERMAKAGLTPSADDLAEFQRMGHEKLAAASESGLAMAKQWHDSHLTLGHRAAAQWLQSATAFLLMAGSVTPAQAAERSDAFVEASARVAGTASQWSGTAARVARDGLEPIHATATSNARRLAVLQG